MGMPLPPRIKQKEVGSVKYESSEQAQKAAIRKAKRR